MRWRERLPKMFTWLGVFGLVAGFLSGIGALSYFAETFPIWTGFNRVPEFDAQGNVTKYVSAKTLWDWLSLLLVPVVLAVGGLLFTWFENRQARELEAQRIVESRSVEERRIQEARELEAQRITENRKIEEERLEVARVLERGRAEDAIVKEYLDQMTDLLLNHALRTSAEDDEVRSVARARTLAALRGVGSGQKGVIVQFLHEARLIWGTIEKDGVDAVVRLRGANLKHANLEHANLENANFQLVSFRGANLQWSVLQGVNFQGADLEGANLEWSALMEANFQGSNLEHANLQLTNCQGANFRGARLQGANLRGFNHYVIIFPERIATSVADFSGADLRGANLIGANLSHCQGLTSEQLLEAESLHGTTLPDDINPADLGDK